MNSNQPDQDGQGTDLPENFGLFLARLRKEMHKQFHQKNDINDLSLSRGFGQGVLEGILACKPFSVAIPVEYGGRGVRVDENLSVLSATAYESLALSLTIGINNGLFLQPIGKYAAPDVIRPVFRAFMEDQAMGGLMITEPKHGSDALNMRTRYIREGDHFRINGMKHWAGLTGMAQYWLLTAREQKGDGGLSRDISFFLFDRNSDPEGMVVEEYFENLGLYPIPYGRNRLDVTVPARNQLRAGVSGISLMLDLLHRSRLQFPGMALGFIQRMLDEAIGYCQGRTVGGKSLLAFDQVQAKLARMQAWFTFSSAACLFSARHAGVENDLSGMDLEANAIKSTVSDHMHESAQLLVQLTGARAYRLNHIGGRGIVDSRPFQIFEGSNDILNIQLGDRVLKGMKQSREPNLLQYLKKEQLVPRAAGFFKELLNITPDPAMPQRKRMELGRIIARTVVSEMAFDLEHPGFRKDLVDNALSVMKHEIAGLVAGLKESSPAHLIVDYQEGSDWFHP